MSRIDPLSTTYCVQCDYGHHLCDVCTRELPHGADRTCADCEEEDQ